MKEESKKLKKLCSSNRRLYETIELADPSSCDSELLEKALDQVFDKLQQCIKWYKAPSEESRKAVQSGKIKWNNKEKSLDANQIEFVTSLSKILLLDQIQCYGILHEYLRSVSVSKSSFEYSEENLNEIMQFYFDDRKCLLNCVSSLFRNSDDESHEYYKPSIEFTEKLIQKGFNNNIESLYVLLRDLIPPKEMDSVYSLKWQEEWIEEQYICLEIMFLIYYSRVSCNAKQLCSLIKLFNVSMTNQPSSHLSENGRRISLKCTYLNTLIIIECLNLESIIEGYAQSKENGVTPTDSSLNELVAIVSTLGTLPFHGPILLGFAVLLAFWNTNNNTNVEWRSFANKSVKLAPIQYFCKLFSNNLFQDDPNITGYKSVIKGFISALLTTFNINFLTEYEHLAVLYTEIFKNEIGLTHQFWEVDYSNENLRSLIDTEKCKFPLVNNQFLPIILSLVTDLDTSRTAFMYLQEFSLFSQPLDTFLKYCDNSSSYSILSNTIEGVSHSYIQLHQNVSIYDGIVLPLNSVGELYTSLQDLLNSSHGSKLQEFSVLNDSLSTIIAPPSIHESHFIQWKLDYSAWFYFIVEIDSLNQRLLASLQISTEQLQTVNHIVTLIDKIINYDHNLTVYIEDHIKDFAGITEDSPIKSKLLPRLFRLVEQLSYSRYNAEDILSGCIRCITSYSKNIEYQTQVWYLVKQHQLFSFGASNQASSIFHHVLNTLEVTTGNYTITLSMLDLLSNLLNYIQSTDISSQSIANEFTIGVEYVRSYIFSSYDTWKYSKLIERFHIGTKILQIFHNIILDTSTTSNPLKQCRDSLLVSLFTDSSVYSVLLNGLVYGKEGLTELFRLRKLKEAHALETLILGTFEISKTMLSVRIRHLEKSQNYDLIPLEQYIFSSNIVITTNKTVPLLAIISSYVDNPYSPVVSQLSVDIIALLAQLPAVVNKDSNSLGANSLVGYLDNQHYNFFSVISRKLKDSKENFALKLSIIQFLHYSVLHQPGITHLVFSTSDNKKDKHSVTDTLIHHVKHIPKDINELQLQSQFLVLLQNLWKNTPQYMSIVNSIRGAHKHLWEWLFKILALKPTSKDRGILYQIVSHVSILKILSFELYYNSNSISTDLLDLLKNNINNIQYSWLNTYLSIPLPIEKKTQLEAYSNQVKIDFNTYLVKTSLSTQSTPVYNTPVIHRKLLHLVPTDVAKEIESLLEENNQLFIYCDSLVELLKSYNTFFQLTISNKIAKNLSPESVQEFMKSILTRMIENIGTQGNLFEDIRFQESCLLQTLTSLWKSIISTSSSINTASLIETLDLFKSVYQLTESWNPKEDLLLSLLTSTLILVQNMPQPSSTSLLPTLMGYASKFLVKPPLVRLNLNLLNSLLQNYNGPSEPVLSLLQTREFFTKIILILSYLLQDYPKYNYAESLFELLLTLSSNHLFGEYLAINGIMKLYSNDSYPLFNDCKSAYNINNERNLAHKLWCLSLSIITQLIRTLKHSEHFVDQCIEFVVIHHQRIINILSSTNNITLAYLEELERITALLYELSNYIERFKLHYSQIFVSVYQKQVVLTLQNCILLLLQPSLISRYAHPISSVEKELPSEEIVDSTSLQLGSITSKITFPQYIEYSLLKVLRNCSNIVRSLTPNLTGSNLKDEMQLWVPLFTPQLEISSSTSSSPPLGVLIGVLNTCFATLRKISAIDQPLSIGDKNLPKIRASEISHLLIFIIQTILYVTLQYLVSITRNQSIKNKVKEELCIEIETFMGRFNKDLTRIIQSTSQKEKLIDHFKDVESYIKNL